MIDKKAEPETVGKRKMRGEKAVHGVPMLAHIAKKLGVGQPPKRRFVRTGGQRGS